MTLNSKILSYFNETESLLNMSIDANKAFMDLMVLAVFADREVTEAELEQLNEELLRLPFIWDNDARDAVTEHSSKTREILEQGRDNAETVSKFIQSITDRLPSSELRTVALRVFIAIAVSDGFDTEEKQMTQRVGQSFGFSSAAIDDLIQHVSETMVSE